MKGFVRLVVMLALIAPVAATAQTKKRSAPPTKAQARRPIAEELSGQGYGVAGCGLGSVLFGAKPGAVQIASWFFNSYISGNQTFGITTGTLNCDITEMGHAAAAFIEINNESFRTELARGEGDTMTSLASILKCSDANLLGSKMREESSSILEDGISSFEATRRIQQTIDKNPELKSTCGTQIVG